MGKTRNHKTAMLKCLLVLAASTLLFSSPALGRGLSAKNQQKLRAFRAQLLAEEGKEASTTIPHNDISSTTTEAKIPPTDISSTTMDPLSPSSTTMDPLSPSSTTMDPLSPNDKSSTTMDPLSSSTTTIFPPDFSSGPTPVVNPQAVPAVPSQSQTFDQLYDNIMSQLANGGNKITFTIDNVEAVM